MWLANGADVVSHLVGLASVDRLLSHDRCWTIYTSVAVSLEISLQFHYNSILLAGVLALMVRDAR
jgi:hypothetical protein